MNYIIPILVLGQLSDTPLIRTIFGQRSANLSDIGRTRTDYFLKLAPLVRVLLRQQRCWRPRPSFPQRVLPDTYTHTHTNGTMPFY